MSIGIYGLFSMANECLWIGQSINIERRYRRHLNSLKNRSHSQQSFSDWFHENEDNNVILKILELCPAEKMNENEGKWFQICQPRFYGQMPSTSRKWFLSEGTKKKMSEAQSRICEEKKRAGIYKSTWESMAEENKIQILQTLKANQWTSEKASKSAIKGNKGISKTDAHKANLAAAAKRSALNIIFCQECGKQYRGKSAFGRHSKTHARVVERQTRWP